MQTAGYIQIVYRRRVRVFLALPQVAQGRAVSVNWSKRKTSAQRYPQKALLCDNVLVSGAVCGKRAKWRSKSTGKVYCADCSFNEPYGVLIGYERTRAST